MMKPINDQFRGDNAHLRRSIKALIELNDDGALVPHGVGGHARALLAAAYHRIPEPDAGSYDRRVTMWSMVILAGWVTVIGGMFLLHKFLG